MAYKWCVLLCAFGFFLLAAVPVGAAEGNDTMAMEEMVVTAGRLPEAKREVTSNITVVDEEEIKQSSARDLGELLAEKNVGHVHKYPGSQTSIGIRGFRTDPHGNDLKGRVLILRNGRRSGTGNASKIVTENIERVEIIRGPASVQYGSAAIGGVINVITKQGQGKPSGFVQGRLGSFGYEKAAAGMSGVFGGFDFSGALSRSTMDDYDTDSGTEYENTEYDAKESINLNLGYEIFPQNRISFIYSGYNGDNIGTPGSTGNPTPDAYVDDGNDSYDILYDGATQDSLFSWTVRYFWGKDEYDYTDPDISLSRRDTDQKGAQAQLTWSPGQYRLTGGIDWVQYEIDEFSSYSMSKNDYEYDNPSYFVMGKAKFMDERLIFTGGLRYDEYDVDARDQNFSDSDSHVSPRLGAAYFLLENMKLRWNYGQGFQMPGADQIAGDAYHIENYSLDPEKSENYEVGLDYYQGAFDSSLTFFYSDVEDRIVAEEIAPWTYQYKNIDEATVSGLEGQASYDVGVLFDCPWKIQPYINFTYLTELEDEETNDDLFYVSDMNVSYGISIADNNGFSTRLNFSYVGDQDIELHDPVTYEPTRIKKGGFTVADLTIQKRILDFNSYGDLSLRGEVRNLFDKDYAYVDGYPMPGRSFVLGMEYSF